MSRLNRALAITKNHSFVMTLNNGYAIRISFGPRDYCDNFDTTKNDDYATRFFTYECSNCQVYISKDGKPYTEEFFAIHFDGMEPKNIEIDKLLEIISIVSLL